MTGLVSENLRRLMAQHGISAQQLSQRTGLDRRTIRGLLTGRNRPHWTTLHRLAEALHVSADELFLEPAQLLYRRVDRKTNPAVDELVSRRPDLFVGWTEGDFDELFSRVATGGPLTPQGALKAVEQMNRNHRAHDQLSVLLETSHAELVCRVIETFYTALVEKPPSACFLDSQQETGSEEPPLPFSQRASRPKPTRPR